MFCYFIEIFVLDHLLVDILELLIVIDKNRFLFFVFSLLLAHIEILLLDLT